tara:strand:+ start:606 stop:878 length:273 start_codon:yes stop_codon:yes gene_type:complete
MQRISRGTKRDMANLDMTVDDIQELFRVMPEAYKEMQVIILKRMNTALESEMEDIRKSYILKEKENPNAESGEKKLPIHAKRDAKSKVRS